MRLRQLAIIVIAFLFLLPTPAFAAPDISLYKAINQYRAAQGKSLLMPDEYLAVKASAKALDMARLKYCEHTAPNGVTFNQRVQSYFDLYRAGYAAENLAAGFVSVTDTVVGWSNSPGHNVNLLDTRAKAIGAARMFNGTVTYDCMITGDTVTRPLFVSVSIPTNKSNYLYILQQVRARSGYQLYIGRNYAIGTIANQLSAKQLIAVVKGIGFRAYTAPVIPPGAK
jgi:hypothetical protein